MEDPGSQPPENIFQPTNRNQVPPVRKSSREKDQVTWHLWSLISQAPGWFHQNPNHNFQEADSRRSPKCNTHWVEIMKERENDLERNTALGKKIDLISCYGKKPNSNTLFLIKCSNKKKPDNRKYWRLLLLPGAQTGFWERLSEDICNCGQIFQLCFDIDHLTNHWIFNQTHGRVCIVLK